VIRISALKGEKGKRKKRDFFGGVMVIGGNLRFSGAGTCGCAILYVDHSSCVAGLVRVALDVSERAQSKANEAQVHTCLVTLLLFIRRSCKTTR